MTPTTCNQLFPPNPLDRSPLWWQAPAYWPLLGWWFKQLQVSWSLPPPPSWAFRSWLVHFFCIEIWIQKVSHMSPAEFLGRGIMYNKTVGKVISLRESCNLPAIDFLKITHCLRAVKDNWTRKMSLFRTPWLAIVINSYNYYRRRGGFSFVKMLLKWQPGDGLKRGNGNTTCCSHFHKRKGWGTNVGTDIRESLKTPLNLRETSTSSLMENSHRNHSSLAQRVWLVLLRKEQSQVWISSSLAEATKS